VAEVVLVRWPEEADDGARLAEQGAAVLYLVDPDKDPPVPTTCLEDWVRMPGDERDLRARVAVLELRASAHESMPRVDSEGRVHHRGRVVALGGPQVGLVRLLIEHFGELVTDRELVEAVDDNPDRDGFRLQLEIARVRARVRDAGLVVKRIRRRGYQLQGR
jgi:DNA-binding response OmpR family regulator